jgi:VIT1/CCC1 family predicted Fe2+/Mn2+ transporter
MAKGNIENEIEEILTRLDKFVPEERRLTRVRRRLAKAIGRQTAGLSRLTSGFSVGHMMIAAFLLIVLSLILNAYDLGIARFAIIAGLVLFGVAFVLSIRGTGRPRPRYEKRWRGQIVDYDMPGPSLGSRIRGWFRRDRSQR